MRAKKLNTEAIKCFKQLRVYDFPIDIYNKNLNVYIGKTIKDVAQGAEYDWPGLDLSDLYDEGAIAYAVRFTSNGLMGNVILISMEGSTKASLLETCAHESVHVSWDILEHVGVKLTADNHEAQAYLVDYIFGMCKDALEHYIKTYKLKIKL
jgi:hypothetical protein